MPYLAVYTPEAWVKDNAIPVDPDGDTEWPLTDEDAHRYAEYQNRTGDHDWIKTSPGAPDWVRTRVGPYSADILDSNRNSLIDV